MPAVRPVCRHWVGAEQRRCGKPSAGRYLTGWCCLAHTPAAVAGRPEPPTTPNRGGTHA